MELAFVIDAVRRYLWLVVLGPVLAVAAGFVVTRPTTDFEATGVVLVTPSGDQAAILANPANSERYVRSQIEVLTSSTLAAAVAEAVGEGASPAAMRSLVDVRQVPDTDIVELTATAPTGERAQQIANAYLDTYVEEVRAATDPGRERLAAELEAIAADLDAVDAAIAEAMLPYLQASAVPVNGTFPPLPTVEQVAPGLLSERSLLLADYTQLRNVLTDMDVAAQTQGATRIIQRADLPTEPVAASGRSLVLAAALVGGAVAGLLGAVLLARFSRTVLSQRDASDVLGHPVSDSLPAEVLGARLVEPVAAGAVPFVDALCVLSDAAGRSRESLVVVVSGTSRGAWTTTLASAMAQRFAAGGASVLLVDVDTRVPELSAAYGSGADDLLALLEDGGAAAARLPEPIEGVRVAGTVEGAALRRQDVAPLVDVAADLADVVVVDAGPLLESAASVHLAQTADAVVLLVPDRQRADRLEVAGQQLRERQGLLLPIWVASSARGRRGPTTPGGRPSPTPRPPTPTDPALASAEVQSVIERARRHQEASARPR